MKNNRTGLPSPSPCLPGTQKSETAAVVLLYVFLKGKPFMTNHSIKLCRLRFRFQNSPA